MKKLSTVALAFALLTTAPIACGGGETSTNSSGDTAAEGGGDKSKVVIWVNPVRSDFSYIPDEAEARAGDVTIELRNPRQTGWEHDLVVEGEDGETIGRTEVILSGTDDFVLKDLQPGEYTFYCSVPGHLSAGMKGTLTVE
jgi:plastocyanin